MAGELYGGGSPPCRSGSGSVQQQQRRCVDGPAAQSFAPALLRSGFLLSESSKPVGLLNAASRAAHLLPKPVASCSACEAE